MNSAASCSNGLASADPHFAASYVDRFDVGCEGELIHAYPTAREALRFAEWSAGVTGCPHEIFDSATRTALLIVEPPKVA